MPASPSLYDILGLEPTASPEQIRKAYKLKALETHPDKLDPKSSERRKQIAEKKFHQVHEAFEILNDPHRKAAYDSRLSQPRTMSLPSFPVHSGPSDEVDRLMKDRAEWARQQQARYQPKNPTRKEPRVANVRSTSFPPPSPPSLSQQPRPAPVPPTPKTPEEVANAQIVESMMQGLKQLDPEWEMRRLSVLKRRAERLTSKPRSNIVRS
ncbi:DnaJ-domain-containing protein [Marasmius fiardii PR-910]|nr:DnaJ-domain-containing protein [Marasmius fiardii PR-910]